MRQRWIANDFRAGEFRRRRVETELREQWAGVGPVSPQTAANIMAYVGRRHGVSWEAAELAEDIVRRLKLGLLRSVGLRMPVHDAPLSLTVAAASDLLGRSWRARRLPMTVALPEWSCT